MPNLHNWLNEKFNRKTGNMLNYSLLKMIPLPSIHLDIETSSQNDKEMF
jgi:hypothetical protein